jgi:hypothetical protein
LSQNDASLSHCYEFGAIRESTISDKRKVDSKKIFDGSFVTKEKILGKFGFKTIDHRDITTKNTTSIGIKGDDAIVAYTKKGVNG